MSQSDSKKNVIAVFRERFNAERAYDSLRAHGYSDSAIHIMMTDDTRNQHYANTPNDHPVGNQSTEGAGVGGGVGAAVGATFAAIAAIGTTLAIPGLGLIIAGPLAAALAGAGAGGVAGGLIGALVGLGIPESNAKAYEAALREGGIVIGVEPESEDDIDNIKEMFDKLDGDNVCYC